MIAVTITMRGRERTAVFPNPKEDVADFLDFLSSYLGAVLTEDWSEETTITIRRYGGEGQVDR